MTLWIVPLSIAAALSIVDAIFILAILRLIGQLNIQLDGLKQIGSDDRKALETLEQLPDLKLRNGNNRAFRLAELWEGRPTLLAFVSAGCASCEHTLRHLIELTSQRPLAEANVCVLCVGDQSELRTLSGRVEFPPLFTLAAIPQDEAMEEFKITMTPTLIAVSPPGNVREVGAGPLSDRVLLEFVASAEAIGTATVESRHLPPQAETIAASPIVTR